MADISEHIVRCCDELDTAIEETVVGALDNVPFRAHMTTPPTIYLFNDGGHGGSYDIKYCPFCGKELKFDY